MAPINLDLEKESISIVEPDEFTYQELPPNHIRILQVTGKLSDQNHHVISARLQDFNINHLPHFIALSYAWPPANSPTRSLSCNSQALAVAEHVYTALENLCPLSGSGSYAIWIDAICINQAEDCEKDDQVSRMGSIYSLASKVIVWLGNNVVVSKHRQEIEDLAAYAVNWKSWVAADDLGKPPLSLVKREVRAAINSFTDSPWFSRLWVIQEVCLGSAITVMCGHCFIDWKSFCKLCNVWSFTRKSSPEKIRNALRVRVIERCISHCIKTNNSYGNAFEIIECLEDVQLQQVSLPIDRIYALLSHIPKRFREKIKIDYSLREEYWKVYIDLARLLLCERSGLLLLRLAQGCQRFSALPSWCPNWNNLNSEAQSLVELPRRYDWDHEHLRPVAAQPMVLFSDDFNHVQIAGFLIGVLTQSFQITAEVEEFPSKDFVSAWLSWQSATLSKLESLAGGPPEPCQLIRRHVKNLLMDSLCHDGNMYRTDTIVAGEWPEVLRCYREAIKYSESVTTDPGQESFISLGMDENVGYGFLKGRATWKAGTYFFTDQGHIGRGVTKEQPGDILVALHTAPTAFILRYQEGCHVTELIGEVYLEDFRDFTTLQSDGKSYTWFTIG